MSLRAQQSEANSMKSNQNCLYFYSLRNFMYFNFSTLHALHSTKLFFVLFAQCLILYLLIIRFRFSESTLICNLTFQILNCCFRKRFFFFSRNTLNAQRTTRLFLPDPESQFFGIIFYADSSWSSSQWTKTITSCLLLRFSGNRISFFNGLGFCHTRNLFQCCHTL